MEAKVKIGDVFCTSWGYDQTNYDYIHVVKITPTGKTAYCQQAFYENVGTEGICNLQKPKAKGWGKIFPMKIRDYGDDDIVLRGTYWKKWHEGQESTSFRLDTFFKHKEGKVYHETDSRFGH